MLKQPGFVFLFSLIALGVSVQIGAFLARKLRPIEEDERDDLTLVVNASLTLLALIIGFSFSMAVSRYDQRKTYEEAEANAIGTEYVRADLLPAAAGMRVRDLLRRYTDLRISFYTTRNYEDLQKIGADTTAIQ